MMNENSNENQQWEELLPKLETYTRSILSQRKWFRGKYSDFYLEGKEYRDYIYTAIQKYLEHPEKFDVAKGSLENYLKYNIIRSLVSNDEVSKENQTTKDVFGIADQIGDDGGESYLESQLPYLEELFEDKIDYDIIMNDIAENVAGESEVENIFISMYAYGMDRREIIKEFEMSESDYNNAYRRLKTIINRVKTKYSDEK